MAVLYLLVSLKSYTKSTKSKYLPSNLNACGAIHNSVLKSPLMSIFRDSTIYAKSVRTTISRQNGKYRDIFKTSIQALGISAVFADCLKSRETQKIHAMFQRRI